MSDESGIDPVGKGMGQLQAAGSAVRQVAGHAQEAGAQAVDQAKELAHEVQEQGSALVGALGEHAGAAAEAGKSSLADQLEDVARAVHRAGGQLEGHQDWMAHLVGRGAAELSVLATTLRTNDMRELMGGIDGIARRQPALFAGASLAAGFALARFGRVAVAGATKADLPTLPGVHHERP